MDGDAGSLDAAFDAWLGAQRAAIEVVRGDVPRTPVELAEGYRWVTLLACSSPTGRSSTGA